MSNKQEPEIELEQGSGNIFADLELEDTDELFACAQIGFCVFKILKERKPKQREAAVLPGIAQSDVSHLMNGHFSRFTTDRLLNFLKRFDRKVTIQITPHKVGESYQEVRFSI